MFREEHQEMLMKTDLKEEYDLIRQRGRQCG